MHNTVIERFLGSLLDMQWRIEIRPADLEMNNILALSHIFHGFFIHSEALW